MKTRFLPRSALAIASILLWTSTPSRADGPNFRNRLPNPAQEIARKFQKVGDFFLRTAQVLEGALPFHDHDDSFAQPYLPPPVEIPPYHPNDQGPYSHLEPPNTPFSRNDYPYLHEQAEQNRLAQRRLRNRQEPQAEPMPLAPSIDEIREHKPRSEKSSRASDANRPTASAPTNEATSNPVPSYRPLPPSSATKKTEPASSPPPTVPNPTPTPIPTTPPQKYQYGRPVPNRPGLVYPPGREQTPANMVDVRGISPGTKVRDPANGSIFLVP